MRFEHSQLRCAHKTRVQPPHRAALRHTRGRSWDGEVSSDDEYRAHVQDSYEDDVSEVVDLS